MMAMRVGGYYSGQGQPLPTGGKIFGASLVDLMNAQKKLMPELKIPVFLYNGFRYIIQHGLEIEGIFRIAGTKDKVRQLQLQLDRGESIDFNSTKIDAVDLADLIKIYFRELPDCLMQSDQYDQFIAALTQDRIGQVQKLRELVANLRPENQELLKELIWFLGKVAINHPLNKMTAENLGLVFGPNLLWKGGKATSTTDMMELMAGAGKIKLLVTLLVEEQDHIFKNLSHPVDVGCGTKVAFIFKLCGYKKTLQGISIVEGLDGSSSSVWTADSGGILKIYNSETYELERELDSKLGRIFTMISVHDHAWIASSAGVSIWERGGKLVKEFPGFHVSLAAVYGPDGELRVWAGTEQKITVFSAPRHNIAQSEVIQTISIPGQFVVSIAEIFGDNKVWVGATSGVIYVFDKVTGEQVQELRTPARRNITCITHHNNKVWAGSEDKQLFVIDPTSFTVVKSIQEDEMLMLNSLKSISQTLWSCSRDSTIRMWDPNTMSRVGQLDEFHTDAIIDAVFHWNNRKLRWEFWSASFDKSVCIWSVSSDHLLPPPPPPPSY